MYMLKGSTHIYPAPGPAMIKELDAGLSASRAGDRPADGNERQILLTLPPCLLAETAHQLVILPAIQGPV